MRVPRFFMSAVVVAGALGVPAAAGATRTSEASHGGRPLHATLRPENEIPPAASNGSGGALVTLNQGQGEVCWDVTVDDLAAPVILAHVHEGAAGVPGPVVVDFVFPANGLSGCVDADATLVKEIRQNPAGFYVNVHTTAFPGGEVRGQLG
jgi:hypothetical protein